VGWSVDQDLSLFPEKFRSDVDEGVGAETGFPIVEVAFGVISRAMVFQGSILDVAVEEISEGADLVVLVKFELSGPDLALYFMSPVLCGLFAVAVITDCGIAFDANDSAPDGCAVFIFAFVNGCHDSNLVV
jgi:hypothetical protein